jgi:hypothetical protein
MTTSGISPFVILLNRTEEKRYKDAFRRHESIEERLRTKHRFAWIDVAAKGELARVPSPLGLGYLKAVLSILGLFPMAVSYDPPGLVGRLDAKGAEMYHLSWNEIGGTECRQGGFIYDGKPNYHAAVLGLAQAIAMYLSGERPQSEEVVTAWCQLLRAMDSSFPRSSREWGWSEQVILAACFQETTRRAILHVCDTLRAAMQYHLAPKSRRAVSVTMATVVEPDEGVSIRMPDWQLLDADWIETTAASVPLLPMPRPVEVSEESAKEAPKTSSPPSGKPSLPPKRMPPASSSSEIKGETTASPAFPGLPPSARSAAESPSSRFSGSRSAASPTALARAVREVEDAKKTASEREEPTEDLYGPYLEQVAMAVAQGGSLLLVGPTGTGKSTLLLDAALREGYGVEMIVCHEGKRIHVLQGGHTREEGKGGDWRFASGPITRLAKRIQQGERVALILDELARAHREVFAYVMDLLNTYSTREILAMRPASEEDDMKLELPPDFGETPGVRYHILAVDILQRRFVVPTNRLLITATANQGEGYGGNDFADPAFCRRWTHWLHLASYDESVVRKILADKCRLPESSPLLDAILQVSRDVHTYHAREDALRMTLSLPMLINWARQTLWYYESPSSKVRSNVRKSFEIAARNTWLARVCPLQGADLDPDVERALLGFVTTMSPYRVR